MKVYRKPEDLKKLGRPIFLTLGTFDGVHKGHRKVLTSLVRSAKRAGGVSCVLTFKEHPKCRIHPAECPKLLTATLHRLILMDREGIDACLLLDFDEFFLRQTPERFVKKYLVEKIGVSEVQLGYRAKFGFHRAGDTELMRRFSQKYGFRFKEVGVYKTHAVAPSSTLIREMIERGDLSGASRFLGRPYSLVGTTVRGQGLGTKLGFPTANLDIHSEVIPHHGVYAVTVDLLKTRDLIIDHGTHLDSRPKKRGLKGVLNFGVRPTVALGRRELVPEVHLIGFRGNLYGHVLEVVFHQKIRDEKKFKTLGELKDQIVLDEKVARRLLTRPL